MSLTQYLWVTHVSQTTKHQILHAPHTISSQQNCRSGHGSAHESLKNPARALDVRSAPNPATPASAPSARRTNPLPVVRLVPPVWKITAADW